MTHSCPTRRSSECVLCKKFQGNPEYVVNYFFFVAEEVREIMAQLGIRRFDDMVGHVELLNMRAGIEHWKAQGLDFSRVFHAVPVSTPLYQTEEQDHALGHALDHQLIDRSQADIERAEKV